MSWHVDHRAWRAYAAGRLDHPAQAAVEAHVAGCAGCQAGAREFGPDTGALWQAVQAEITRPQPPWPLRWLSRLGVPQQDMVVLTASDNLRLPWAVAIGGALVSVIAGASLGRFDQLGFLLLSPLVPVLAVLAAYESTDPLRPVTIATPFSKLRLGLLRTIATLLVALPVLLGLSALVPVLHGLAWVWLLPSLALTGTALVLLRWLSSAQAAGVVVAGWTLAILAIAGFGRLDQIGSIAGQAVFAVVTVLASGLFVLSAGRSRPVGGVR